MVRLLVQKSLSLLFCLLCFSAESLAEKSRSLNWDLGASIGSYGGSSYSQIDLGVNWFLTDFLNWRNVAFSRFGNSITQAAGLDSSLLYDFHDGDNDFSYRLFAGPGVRVSSAANTGYFGEAGVVIHTAGLNLGGGVKAINYSNPGTDPTTGLRLPSSDVSYFLIFSGGGGF
jgi:hypothetical protein